MEVCKFQRCDGGACLGEALAVKCSEVLVLKRFANLDHAVRPEVEDRNSVAILYPNFKLSCLQSSFVVAVLRKNELLTKQVAEVAEQKPLQAQQTQAFLQLLLQHLSWLCASFLSHEHARRHPSPWEKPTSMVPTGFPASSTTTKGGSH